VDDIVNVIPAGINPTPYKITVLGMPLSGVTCIVALPVCPAVTLIVASDGNEKSGMFTLTTSPLALD
jgi:hypothetical protein